MLSLHKFIYTEEMGREVILMSIFPLHNFLNPPLVPDKLFSMLKSLTRLWTSYF
ncbi:MAG: hypothetical protein KPI85_06910 [cyanobacterium endosymbiont of Epithemia adnata isolate EadnSB Bon19]